MAGHGDAPTTTGDDTMVDVGEGSDDVSPTRVAWLMENFKAVFDALANHAGYTPARGYEMLNALALEASSLIKAAEDAEDQRQLREYFLAAFNASLTNGEEEYGAGHA